MLPEKGLSMPDVDVTTYPDKEAWLAARMAGIGSSEAAIVLGLSPFKTPLALYGAKLGVSTDDGESEAMEWGRILEPVIAERYATETRRPIEAPAPWTLYRSCALPVMLATPDRFVIQTADHGGIGLLEIKTAGAFRADEWAEEPPLYYQVQLQHQLAVLGLAWGSLAVLIGGQRFVWCDLQRNERFIALLRERLAAFWARLERLDPPTPTGADLDALARLYPIDAGTSVPLPAEAVEWDRAYREALETIKGAEKARDEAKALLQAAIGEASYGVLPAGGGRYSWKAQTQERAAQEAKTLTFRTLRRLTQ